MRVWVCVIELQMRAKRRKGWSVSSAATPVFYFLLVEWKQRRKWEGVASFFRIAALGYRKLTPSGWVCLLGEVLDFCDRRSCETVSEVLEFYNNISWDVAAELLLWGVMLCKRWPNSS